MRYYFADPRILTAHEARLKFDPRSAIIAGLDAWAKLNPRLVFIRTPHKSRLAIRCTRLVKDNRVGEASQGTFPGGTIRMDLVKHSTYDEIRDTIAHEFGHICGYPHTAQSGHLMFSSEMYGCNDDEEVVARHHSGRKARQFKIPEPADPRRFYDWDKHLNG